MKKFSTIPTIIPNHCQLKDGSWKYVGPEPKKKKANKKDSK